MDQRRIWRKIISNWRIIIIFFIISLMLFALSKMYSPVSGLVANGKVDLSRVDFTQNKTIDLNGQWEFYWDRLLTSEDFMTEDVPEIDSFIKVPGSWNDSEAGIRPYPNHGVATYRLILTYPDSLRDPALSIKTVSAAYKLYANGQLIVEVGKVAEKLSDYEGDYRQLIVGLPNNTSELELIIQVANLNYSRGGLRDSLVFGSKQVLDQQKFVLFATQLIVIGSVFGFGIYYFLLFLLHRKNKTALLFSLLCLTTALRALVWGETPLMILFPKLRIQDGILIEYITKYSLLPLIILFVISLYPMDYHKKSLTLILLPTLFFEALLLAPAGFRASFNTYFYIFIQLQMIYILCVLIQAVHRRRDNALLLFIVISVFNFTILADLLRDMGMGNINLSYMFVYGNFAVIMAMSFIQARQQASTQQKLILYNQNLIEADRLKDKIMATEMSFLQAQIKPHFLYNALSAIANVSEMDGKKAGKLIIDLALYLRKSLVFNHLDKMDSIEKELEFIDTYFNIEQARFGHKIRLQKEIEIPLNHQILVLILQPLVENAVRHGISKKTGGGTVRVKMNRIDEGIHIEIEDDGVGIPSEKLVNLLTEEGKGQGVGLLNIHHRLLRLYGRGLTISSEEGLGTCVRLLIPKGEKNNDQDSGGR
ncbi:sensor histidine kinase [Desulfosporosinus hippei]|uniref:histidine kinase n=1 Tax=Desulfosporosinus hippei DSM 8344 TaxID=1121419 RepID=A0A1G8CIM2_9FIRM|nr:histidine kinase [Desulfosporosinus hippei]SDH45282.1 Histidine kinase-, DNA gyrase B-, and HSP90-like ATPase [Desulfosporosinus hippei DSM 8344]